MLRMTRGRRSHLVQLKQYFQTSLPRLTVEISVGVLGGFRPLDRFHFANMTNCLSMVKGVSPIALNVTK